MCRCAARVGHGVVPVVCACACVCVYNMYHFEHSHVFISTSVMIGLCSPRPSNVHLTYLGYDDFLLTGSTAGGSERTMATTMRHHRLLLVTIKCVPGPKVWGDKQAVSEVTHASNFSSIKN